VFLLTCRLPEDPASLTQLDTLFKDRAQADRVKCYGLDGLRGGLPGVL
jgi:hypothetical protein